MFLVTILLLAILAIGAVSASEDISDDVSAIESTDEVVTDSVDEVISNQIDDSVGETEPSIEKLEETDPQEEILEEENEVKSLTDLENRIENAQGDIVLENDYKYSQGDYNLTEIEFDYSYDLDGQGYTIDGDGKHISFVIWGNDVTVKNLIFKNLNNNYNGHPLIYVNGTGVRIENCTFENITHEGNNAPIIWVKACNSIISNCTFKDTNSFQFMNIQNDDDPLGNVQINNCTFTNGNASYSFISAAGYGADKIQVNNCSFEGINASYYLLHIYGNDSQINNCTFKDNIGGYYGFITRQEGNNTIMHNCTFENNIACNSDNPDSSPIAVFGDTHDDSYENIFLTNTTFKNNKGIPIRWYAESGNVTGCVFIGNNGTIDNQGNVYRDNGKYDFEVIVKDNIIIGASGGYVPLDPVGPGGFIPIGGGDDNLFVNITNYGPKQGNIVILLNGTECYNKVESEKHALINIDDLNPLKAGELNLVIKYVFGEGEYDLYDDTITINYLLRIINSEVLDGVSPNGAVDLYITLPKTATGTLIFSDENQNRTIEYADGEAKYTLKASDYKEMGIHSFTITLVNDPNFPEQGSMYDFSIWPNVDVPMYIAEGETDYITYDFPDDIMSNLLIYHVIEGTSGDYEYELILNESIKGFGLVPLPENLTLYKGEDSKVHLKIVVPGVELKDDESIVYIINNNENFSSRIESNTIDIGGYTLINVTSKSTENAVVYLFIDYSNPMGKEPQMYPLEGSDSLNIHVSNLAPGQHKIKMLIVSMLLGPVYSNNFIVTVGRDPTLAIVDMGATVEEGSPATIHITANETFSGAVTVYVNGKELGNITLSNGEADFVIGAANLKLGENTVKVTSQANDVFFAGSAENSFTVIPKENGNSTPSGNKSIKVPAKIVAKNYSAYYNKGIYTVKVYGTDGKLAKGVTVVFKIKGKKVKTVKTNSKGIAKFKIPAKFVPKKYKITVSALGKTVTKIVTIKQVLKLKKVKVKRSAKKLIITATLKEGKKALKGKKIIFRFKGKKYTRKTNKKGVAKLVIKKKVLKKLKVGKKVTYKATYLKDTVKRTVKVKK